MYHGIDRGYAFLQGGPLHGGAGQEVRTRLQLIRQRDCLQANPHFLQRQAGGDAGAASEVPRVCLSMPPGTGVQAL